MKNYNANGDENINSFEKLIRAFKTVLYFFLMVGLIAYIIYVIVPKKENNPEKEVKKVENKKFKGTINFKDSTTQLIRINENKWITDDGDVIYLY